MNESPKYCSPNINNSEKHAKNIRQIKTIIAINRNQLKKYRLDVVAIANLPTHSSSSSLHSAKTTDLISSIICPTQTAGSIPGALSSYKTTTAELRPRVIVTNSTSGRVSRSNVEKDT